MKTTTRNLNYPVGSGKKSHGWFDANHLMLGITVFIFFYLIFRFVYPILSEGILW
jgi:hypothetical protein